jgi:predicted secreted protein with PEFG-CTERM motif
MVLAPNGNVVSIDQINPDSDGSFTSTIGVGGPMWKQDGMYEIAAQQGSASINKATVEVEIADGAVVPEFGTIASLVLVVAISSIVVLSAKGRLSFTPRI